MGFILFWGMFSINIYSLTGQCILVQYYILKRFRLVLPIIEGGKIFSIYQCPIGDKMFIASINSEIF